MTFYLHHYVTNKKLIKKKLFFLKSLYYFFLACYLTSINTFWDKNIILRRLIEIKKQANLSTTFIPETFSMCSYVFVFQGLHLIFGGRCRQMVAIELLKTICKNKSKKPFHSWNFLLKHVFFIIVCRACFPFREFSSP